MHKIAIIGTGYVGLVTGTCLADFGMEVTCVDNNIEKIEKINNGKIPIFESGLDELVKKNTFYKRLKFTTDIKKAVEENKVIFIAVGTPPADDGSADLQHVVQVAKDIARHMNGYKVIVDKSTVPVGTGQKVKGVINNVLQERGVNYEFDVVSNPEFLREGSAIYDFTHPDRVVIGSETKKATQIMQDVYRVLYLKGTPFVVTNLETAEMIKYASNAFLALKVTYINEVANLCEKVGADVQQVANAMGMDQRISPKFLQPGPGYGGSCFPKDTRALANIAKEHGERISLIETTIEANERQKVKMIEKIVDAMGDIEGKIIGILGITFKPKTDDMRDAPSLVILPGLTKLGAKLKIFDPKGEKEGKWRLEHIKDSVEFCQNEYDAISDADALVILTEWDQFRKMDLDRLKNTMKDNYFFDLRNVYCRETVEEKGFRYYCVGR